MSRPFRARALVAVLMLFAAAGCQDYNFNPVGHCVLQPGTQKFTLSNVSSADVLFVVDDSGSMAGEQDRLADAFTDFVENLTSTNRGRAQGGLLPLDFHVAVTTTSIFRNRQGNGTPPMCRSGCTGATGLACCIGNVPVYGPRRCTVKSATPTAECPLSGTVCSDKCAATNGAGYKGELYCCSGVDGTFPVGSTDSTAGQIIGCNLEGVPCGDLQTHYDYTDSQCTASTHGVSLDGFPYPDGAFVGSTNVSSVVANPRVLHFDKRLYYSGANSQGFTMPELKRFFEQNVRVGTCGSMEEQGLQASYDAVKAALAGKQLDTFAYDWAAGVTSGTSSRITQTFSAPGGMPTLVTPAVWPTPNSKLVVVYVGDEDDCSSPKDASAGVVLETNDSAGADACVRDATETAPLGGKQYGVSKFVNYLAGLGRPLGAAFIVSATAAGDDVSCSNEGCVAGICCDRPCVEEGWASGLPAYASKCSSSDPSTCVCAFDICGGQAPGTRFIQTATALKAKGADVVVGSICGDFKPLLRSVADIVKPPQTLALPSVPAEAGIALLRIADSSGITRKLCRRPLAPTQPAQTRLQAEATGADWWFVGSVDPGPPYDPTGTATVAVPYKYVYINPKGSCIANPGETYSLDYLGVVPAGGCVAKDGDADAGLDGILGTADDIVNGSVDCQNKMGGRFSDWQCYVPSGLTTGTCQCRSGG
jgi:hypothetical protein